MTWTPLVDPVLLAILAITIVAAVTWPIVAALRHGAMTWGYGVASWLLRMLAVSSLVTILAGPTITRTAPDDDTPAQRLPMLVDRTLSMCVDDAQTLDGVAARRIDLIDDAWLDPTFLAELGAYVTPEIIMLGDQTQQVSSETARDTTPVARETRLVRAVEGLIEAADPDVHAGLLILSDGHDTTGRTVAPLASRASVPIFAAVPGSTERQPDVGVRLTADHELVFRGEQTTLRAEIQQFGLAGREVELSLAENDAVIERRRIVLDETTTSLTWDVTPTAPSAAQDERDPVGELSSYTLRVTPLPDERVIDNNERHAFVEVQRERIHVALFENEPYWDSKYLVSALRTDPQIRLTTVTGFGRRVRVAHHRATEMDPDAPVLEQDVVQGPMPDPLTRDWLFHYDVVVLGRGVDRWFKDDAVELLREFVLQRGGSLVLARGVPFDPDTAAGRDAIERIASLLPVALGGPRPLDGQGGALALTREGEHVPALDFEGFGDGETIISSMPGMLARTVVADEKAMSTVWLRSLSATGNETDGTGAAVAHQRIGRGMVMMVLTDGLWRWALMRPEMEIYDPVFRLFWIRAVRWLAGSGELLPGRSVGLSLSRLAIEPDEPVEITVQTRFVDPSWFAPTLSIIDPSGSRRTMDLTGGDAFSDRLVTTFTPRAGVDPSGVYTVVLDCPDLAPPRLVKRFAVYDPTRELLDTSARVDEMSVLVTGTGGTATGGAMLPVNDPSSLLDLLKRKAEANATTPVSTDAWPRWWVLAILVGCLCAEWMLRWWTGRL